MNGPITKWTSGEVTFTCLFSSIQAFASDFTHRCLSSPERDGDAALNTAQQNEAPRPLSTFDPWTPTPLLRQWAKTALTSGEWKDALAVTVSVSTSFCSGTPRGIDTPGVEFVVPRFTIFRVICERLETIHRLTHASECFRQMVDELSQEIRGTEANWVLGE